MPQFASNLSILHYSQCTTKDCQGSLISDNNFLTKPRKIRKVLTFEYLERFKYPFAKYVVFQSDKKIQDILTFIYMYMINDKCKLPCT